MENVTVTLCIGLVGVCVISLLNDESDIVYTDILDWGTDDWFDRLPKHEKPTDGVYSIELVPTPKQEDLVTYEIVGVNH